MPNRVINCKVGRMGRCVVTIAVALAFSSISFAQTGDQPAPARARRPPEKASTEPFDKHNLTAIWILRTPFAGISNTPPPMTPFGQAKFNANKPSYGPRAVPPAEGNDVIGNCDPTGFPRNLFSPSRAVQFVQLPNELLQVFQYHGVWRQIWMDGRELPKDADPSWYGTSVGKWDGDTFVVNTVGLDEKTWLDHFGYPHSGDMRVEERYTRVDHDTFELILTVDDPKTYTMPWVSPKKTFKLANPQALEEDYCVPSEEQHFNSSMRNPADGKSNQ